MVRIVQESHAMVAHVWAQDSQPQARSSDGRMYSEFGLLYSYGNHFVLGVIMPDGVALLNSSGYSVSTGKHKSHTSRAVSHRTSYGVPDLSELRSIRTYAHAVADAKANKRPLSDRWTRYRATITRHVEAHYRDLSDGAGAYLLGLAGARKPDAAWATLRAKLVKADARAADAAKRKLLLDAISICAFVAGQSDDDFNATLPRLPRNPSEYDNHRYADSLIRERKELNVAKRRAGAKLSPTRKAAVNARLADYSAIIEAHEKATERQNARNRARNLISTYRATLAALPVNVADWSMGKSFPIQSFASAAENLALRLPALPLGGYALPRIEKQISEARLAHRSACERESLARMAAEKQAREDWLNGKPGTWYGSDERGGAYVRAVNVERDPATGTIIGGDLQTSHHATVPLVHALRAFRFVLLCRERGQDWVANGRTIRAGHFNISRITADGTMTAGCHTIHWQAIAGAAERLGVMGFTPSEAALETTPGH